MDMSINACWDCPVRLTGVLLTYAVLVLIAFTAGRLQRSERAALRTLGIGVTGLTLLFVWALTISFLRWGILRSSIHTDVYSQSATYAILFVMNTAVIFSWCAARLRRRSRPVQPA